MPKPRRISPRVLSLLAFVLLAVVTLVWYVQTHRETSKGEFVRNDSGIPVETRYARFAQGFRIDTIPGFQILTINNPWHGHDQRFQWLLQDSASKCPDCEIPDSLLALPRLRLPLRHIVALSSTHLAMLAELHALDRVVGVSRLDLINAKYLRDPLLARKVPQVGYGPSIQIEQVLALTPDVVLTFGVGDTKFDDYPVLQAAHIPALVLSEWMEPHPLGRLEWIRLLGVLLKREPLADSIFADRATRYDSLCAIAKQFSERPTVLTGMSQGDTWYLTGGRNYFAQFLRDAGAHYLWDDDTSRGGIQVNFEQALELGGQAEYWINPGIWNQRAATEKLEPRVKLFAAWQAGRTYQHDKKADQQGSSDFWELGMVRPDLVLADLIQVLHPGSLPNYSSTFYHPLP